MDELAKLTASGRKFTFTNDDAQESKPTSFYVKPVKIRLHPELKEDSKFLLSDPIYLQLENEEEKAILFKWIERQVCDSSGKPTNWDALCEAGATYEDIRDMLMALFQDSGFH